MDSFTGLKLKQHKVPYTSPPLSTIGVLMWVPMGLWYLALALWLLVSVLGDVTEHTEQYVGDGTGAQTVMSNRAV